MTSCPALQMACFLYTRTERRVAASSQVCHDLQCIGTIVLSFMSQRASRLLGHLVERRSIAADDLNNLLQNRAVMPRFE